MTRVPILNFHSVGDDVLPFDLRHLSTHPKVLEKSLQWLNRHDFTTISLEHLFSHLQEGSPVPDRSLVLAFDDGYLDNWCFVHPLLKKYGHQGFILVTPEFVPNETEVRPTIEDVWQGNLSPENLPKRGYCNWEELRAMHEAGTLKTYSHSMTHTWWPTSSKVVDFHRPNAPWIPGIWKENPIHEKPYWMTESSAEIARKLPWGAPVFENARSQCAPRVFPPALSNHPMVEYVRKHGGEDFFKKPGWKERLLSTQTAPAESVPRESQEDYETRLRFEFGESRRIIEQEIPGHTCSFFAWPGGEWNETTQKIALEFYDATLTTQHHVTISGEDPQLIHRLFFGQRSHELTGLIWPSVWKFTARLLQQGGHSKARIRNWIANRAIGLGKCFLKGNRNYR